MESTIGDIEINEEWSSNGTNVARMQLSRMHLETKEKEGQRKEEFVNSGEGAEVISQSCVEEVSPSEAVKGYHSSHPGILWSRSIETIGIGDGNGSDEGAGDFSNDGSSSDDNTVPLRCDDSSSSQEPYNKECQAAADEKEKNEVQVKSEMQGIDQLPPSPESEDQKQDRSEVVPKTSLIMTTDAAVVVVTTADISMDVLAATRGQQAFFSEETRNAVRSLGKVMPVVGDVNLRHSAFGRSNGLEPVRRYPMLKNKDADVSSNGDVDAKPLTFLTNLLLPPTLSSPCLPDRLPSGELAYPSLEENARAKQSVTLVQYILPSFTFRTTPQGKSVQIALCGPSVPRDNGELDIAVRPATPDGAPEKANHSEQALQLVPAGLGVSQKGTELPGVFRKLPESSFRADERFPGTEPEKFVSELYEQWSAHIQQRSQYTSRLAFGEMSRVSLLQNCEESQKIQRK